jgi:hypothetical protein
MSAQGAPVRSRQKILFNTRRSSTRFTPRTLVGSNRSITDHSKSVKSSRAITSRPIGKTESHRSRFGKFRLWVRGLVHQNWLHWRANSISPLIGKWVHDDGKGKDSGSKDWGVAITVLTASAVY